MLVAIDCGRSFVKVMTCEKIFMFPSKISAWRKRNYRQVLPEDIELTYKGNKWFVGKLAEREGEFTRQAMKDTKAVEETLLLTLAAIYLATPKKEVKIVTGLPIANYTEQEKKALKSLLRMFF